MSSHPSWLVSVLRPWDPESRTTFTCSCSSFEWFFTCFLAIWYFSGLKVFVSLMNLRHTPETAGVRVPLVAPGHLTSVGFLRKGPIKVGKSPNIVKHLPGPCGSAHAWPGRWSWRTPCCSRACRGRAAPRCGSACGSSDFPAGQNFYYIPLAAMRNMSKLETRSNLKIVLSCLADIWFLPCVDPHVCDQLVLGVEWFEPPTAALQQMLLS